MSYSFSVRGSNKSEALQKAKDEFDRVVQTQPAHQADRDQAIAATEAFVNVLTDDDTKDIALNVTGSVSWRDADGKQITSAGVSVWAGLADRTS